MEEKNNGILEKTSPNSPFIIHHSSLIISSIYTSPKFLRSPFFQTAKLLRETFDFLGFEFRWDLTREGRPGVFKRTSKKKLKASLANFTQWAKSSLRRKVKKWGKTLRAKFQGYWNYFGVRGNFKSLEMFYWRSLRILFKWMNRRSSRRSYTWDGFQDMLKALKIPEPRITEVSVLSMGISYGVNFRLDEGFLG